MNYDHHLQFLQWRQNAQSQNSSSSAAATTADGNFYGGLNTNSISTITDNTGSLKVPKPSMHDSNRRSNSSVALNDGLMRPPTSLRNSKIDSTEGAKSMSNGPSYNLPPSNYGPDVDPAHILTLLGSNKSSIASNSSSSSSSSSSMPSVAGGSYLPSRFLPPSSEFSSSSSSSLSSSSSSSSSFSSSSSSMRPQVPSIEMGNAYLQSSLANSNHLQQQQQQQQQQQHGGYMLSNYQSLMGQSPPGGGMAYSLSSGQLGSSEYGGMAGMYPFHSVRSGGNYQAAYSNINPYISNNLSTYQHQHSGVTPPTLYPYMLGRSYLSNIQAGVFNSSNANRAGEINGGGNGIDDYMYVDSRNAKRYKFAESNQLSSRQGLVGVQSLSSSGGGNNNSGSSLPSSRPALPLNYSSITGAGDDLGLPEVMKFLDHVQKEFEDKPTIYMYFLDAVKDFKTNQLDMTGFVTKMRYVFSGHNNLLIEFNNFLPDDYKIVLTQEEFQKSMEKAEANKNHENHSSDAPKPSQSKYTDDQLDFVFDFIEDVQETFEKRPQVYRDFVNIVLLLMVAEINNSDVVIDKIMDLFKDKREMLLKFVTLLTDTDREKVLQRLNFPMDSIPSQVKFNVEVASSSIQETYGMRLRREQREFEMQNGGGGDDSEEEEEDGGDDENEDDDDDNDDDDEIYSGDEENEDNGSEDEADDFERGDKDGSTCKK